MKLVRLKTQEPKLFKNHRFIFRDDSSNKKDDHNLNSLATIDPGTKLRLKYEDQIRENNTIKDSDYQKHIAPLFTESKYFSKQRYQDFLEALSKGKFAKNPLKFLEALKKPKSSKERKHAEEIIKNLKQDTTGKLNESTEKAELQKMEELRVEDMREGLKDKATETAGVSSKPSSLSGITKLDIKKLVPEYRLWVPEDAPLEVKERLSKLYKDSRKNMEETIRLHDHMVAADKAGDDATVERLKIQIAARERELKDLIEKLNDPEWQDIVSKRLKQYRAIKQLSSTVGIDLIDTPEIVVWLLGEDKKSEQIKGLQIAIRERKNALLLVKEITFEPTEEKDEAGRLIVDFIDEDGNESTADFRQFQNYLIEREAYGKPPEIADQEELQYYFLQKLGYEVSPGTEFYREIVTGRDDLTGQILKDLESFQVKDIYKGQNGEWQIFLDKEIIITHSGHLPYLLPQAAKGDRKLQTLPLGQFITFLKRIPGAKRKFHDLETYRRALQSSKANHQREKEYFILGETRDIRTLYEKIERLPGESLTDEEAAAARSFLGIAPEVESKVPEFGESKPIRVTLDNGQIVDAKLATTKNADGIIQHQYQIPTRDIHNQHISLANAVSPLGSAAKDLKDKNGRTVLNTGMRNPDGSINLTIPANQHQQLVKNGQIIQPNILRQEDSDDEKKKNKKVKPDKKQEEAPQDPPPPPPPYAEIALPYEEVYKTGLESADEAGFLRATWMNTRFMSLGDFWAMGKTIWEYVKRKWDRNQKEKYANVGENLPFISPEMKRIKTSAETEEVNQFQQSLDNEGISDIQSRLRTTRNKDELKACFIVLSQKGQLRWDDVDMWKQLNRWIPSSITGIPIPPDGDPNRRVSDKDNRTGFDFLQPVIDSIWGSGSYNDWYRQNKSNYDSHSKSFYERGNELELIEGGHQKELQGLLKRHKAGEWVDPHYYEGLISHAIESGKSSTHTKLYYMIQGVAAKNPDGETILDFRRIAHINSKLLNQFPLLDFMTLPAQRDAKRRHRWTVDDYEKWAAIFDKADSPPGACIPNAAVDNFLWTYVLPDKSTQTRTRKALTNPTIDHEDVPFFFPLANITLITDLTQPAAGNRRFFSTDAYANAYPGFSQYLRSCQETNRERQLIEGLAAYLRFDSIMAKRYDYPAGNRYYRMDSDTYNRPPVMSEERVKDIQGQINDDVIKPLLEEFSKTNSDLASIKQYIFMNPEGKSKAEQDQITFALDKVGDYLTKAIEDRGEEGAQILYNIVKKANLVGMTFTDDEKRDRANAIRESQRKAA